MDRDPALLALAADATATAAAEGTDVDCVEGDLAREGLEAVARADLVTASALLDLVSEDWLTRLVAACARSRCAALFALTWDGSIEWSTRGGADAEDALVLDAIRAHQGRDKGLGPALGPTAGTAAEAAFRASGFRTWQRPSPWNLGSSDGELARALIEGWREAATEQRPDQSECFSRWAARRTRVARGDGFRLVVGHVDLLALPEGS
jgi:hypothetical protein